MKGDVIYTIELLDRDPGMTSLPSTFKKVHDDGSIFGSQDIFCNFSQENPKITYMRDPQMPDRVH